MSRTSGRRAACAAGRLDGAYWLIGPGSAGLAQGCPCALPLQAWAGAYCGGCPLHSLFELLFCCSRCTHPVVGVDFKVYSTRECVGCSLFNVPDAVETPKITSLFIIFPYFDETRSSVNIRLTVLKQYLFFISSCRCRSCSRA